MKPRRHTPGHAGLSATEPAAEESSQDMVDEVDEFHKQKELVMLEQYNGAGSTDEESETDEEILPLELSNDEYGDEEEVDDAPSRAWGQTKDSFYNIVDDPSSDEGAEHEEIEAIALQHRLSTALSEADYEAPVAMETECTISNDQTQEEITIAQDLSKLSKEAVLTLLSKDSPEVFELLEKFNSTLSHVLTKVLPAIEVARQQSEDFTEKEKQFLEAHLHLHLCYCVNIMFYLLLKSSQTSTHSHPVIGSLYKIRQMLSYMSRVEGQLKVSPLELVKRNPVKTPEKKHTANAKQINKVDSKPVVSVKPLEYYELVKMNKLGMKKSSPTDMPSLSHIEMIGASNNEETKRAITFQIARNKGIVPKRRKEQRNPRVKHRNKFKKAVIRRKSQVLPVTTEMNRYDGEASGIRSHLTRSVKIM